MSLLFWWNPLCQDNRELPISKIHYVNVVAKELQCQYVFITRNSICNFGGGWGWICKCFVMHKLMKNGLKSG